MSGPWSGGGGLLSDTREGGGGGVWRGKLQPGSGEMRDAPAGNEMIMDITINYTQQINIPPQTNPNVTRSISYLCTLPTRPNQTLSSFYVQPRGT